MFGVPGLKKRFCGSVRLGGVFILLAAAATLFPHESFAQLRDEEYIRRHAQPYISRFLKELKAYERDLPKAKSGRRAALTRLSRVCFNLGELTEHRHRLAWYEKGKSFAEILVKEEPGRVEGHYWLGTNLGGMAEVGGAGLALQTLPELVKIFAKAASIDPVYDQAGAHRSLGGIFGQAPAWPISVGDLNKSLHHLALAVQIAPENSTNHLFLGYTLMQMGRSAEARAALQRVFEATAHSVWPPGVEHDRREARRLLKELDAADNGKS
ncbi:MAG: hypothetical protein QME75_03060 [Deltaproteobacteria bacterium]|nr:hypothetical protein [Deltaproteobacteria bacterium]